MFLLRGSIYSPHAGGRGRGRGEGNVSPKLRARDQDSKALYIAHYYRDNAIAGVQMDGSFRTISLLADIRRTKIKLEG
jgi:hypothetical protein